MIDPTPDATSPFERACAALAASVGYDWAVMVQEYPTQAEGLQRGLAAALRELREPTSALMNAALPRAKAHHSQIYLDWQAMLDAILKDAPNG